MPSIRFTVDVKTNMNTMPHNTNGNAYASDDTSVMLETLTLDEKILLLSAMNI
jgi:hypothetical protein